MARPIVIRDEDILEAARAVFLERGVRATAQDVARTAGVSEGTVFKRFRTKFELFEAAMGPASEDPALISYLPLRVGAEDLEHALVSTGVELCAALRRVLPLLMMAWSNPGESGTPAVLDNPMPLRVLSALTEYFADEQKLGRIAGDPDILARTFMGAVYNFVLFDVLYRAPDSGADERFARRLVSLLMKGALPRRRVVRRRRVPVGAGGE
ncbi:MAG: TetR/AcrR family transcriptional regulator [Myxococcales bacterium]|nr:TetR/AcrR family transcriptional regulator [Myxococcales bacterium]MCB9580353.1 TetR/AcrR family transcriptional regulator [Polyangiaceae bacterium]